MLTSSLPLYKKIYLISNYLSDFFKNSSETTLVLFYL